MHLDSARPHDRLDDFRHRCAEFGLALTPQRLAIYQALAADDSHPGAEEIYSRVKPTMPSLSLGTVYRTLEVFEQHGLVTRVNAFGDQARFDADLTDHTHLACVRCQRVFDAEPAGPPPAPPTAAAERLGFHVIAARVLVLGICATCQSTDVDETNRRGAETQR